MSQAEDRLKERIDVDRLARSGLSSTSSITPFASAAGRTVSTAALSEPARSVGSSVRRNMPVIMRETSSRSLTSRLSTVILWAATNELLSLTGYAPLDPRPYFCLQGMVALYAALIGTMVLITQTRQQRHAEQRAYLELQVNLISEQKVAKLIALMEELRRDIPSVQDRVDPEANAMTHAVDPQAVMTALEETLDSGLAPSTELSPHNSPKKKEEAAAP